MTGASSGIGAELARALAGRGHGVVAVARRSDRLEALCEELSTRHGVRAEPLACDVADAASRAALPELIGAMGLDVEVLVNNAGFGSWGGIHRADPDRLSEMVRTNCEAPVDLVARLSGPMVDRGRGAILNVGSTSSFQPLPGTAAYAATKALVLSFSEATSAELGPRGVTVTCLCPGPVGTGFQEAAGMAPDSLSYFPSVMVESAERVAEEGIRGLERDRRVVVPGAVNRLGAVAGQHAPRFAFLGLARRFGPSRR